MTRTRSVLASGALLVAAVAATLGLTPAAASAADRTISVSGSALNPVAARQAAEKGLEIDSKGCDLVRDRRDQQYRSGAVWVHTITATCASYKPGYSYLTFSGAWSGGDMVGNLLAQMNARKAEIETRYGKTCTVASKLWTYIPARPGYEAGTSLYAVFECI